LLPNAKCAIFQLYISRVMGYIDHISRVMGYINHISCVMGYISHISRVMGQTKESLPHVKNRLLPFTARLQIYVLSELLCLLPVMFVNKNRV
jgi:hypothetical protein